MANNLKKLDFQQIIRSTYDESSNSLQTQSMGSLVPEPYDELVLTYVTAGNGLGEIETVTYKKDGSTIAVITLGYDGSDKLISVVRS